MPAQRFHALTVTCAAGIAASAAIETALTIPAGIVTELQVVIPGGHAFLTGIAIALGHQQILPYDNGTFLLGDDDRFTFDPPDDTGSGAWSAFTYNTDTVYAHEWQVRFTVSVLERVPAEVVPAVLAVGDIYGAMG